MPLEYVCFKLLEDIRDLNIKTKWIKYLPKRLYDYYIYNKINLPIIKKEILDVKSYEITLPITKEEILDKSKEYITKLINKAMNEIDTHKIIVACNPDGIFIKNRLNVLELNDENILPLFMVKVIEEIVELTQKDMKIIKVTIITGKDKMTDFVINYIYPEYNNLTLIVEDDKRYKEKANTIFEDVGLDVGIKNIDKIRKDESDFVINTCNKKLKIHNIFQRNSILIDLVNNKELQYQIKTNRRDMVIIDNISIKYKEIEINKIELSAILAVRHYRELRSYFVRRYNKLNANKVKKIIHSYHFIINKFLYEQNMIKRKNIIKLNS